MPETSAVSPCLRATKLRDGRSKAVARNKANDKANDQERKCPFHWDLAAGNGGIVNVGVSLPSLEISAAFGFITVTFKSFTDFGVSETFVDNLIDWVLASTI